MTEPQGGSDPSLFTTRAVRDGDTWVIDGEKWFSSSFEPAAFIIVMAVTDPDVSVYQGTSMFCPGRRPRAGIIRRTGVGYDPVGEGNHPYVRYNAVRVPAENLLGGEGQALRHRPDPARRRPTAPRDAYGRGGFALSRHVVRTGAEPDHSG